MIISASEGGVDNVKTMSDQIEVGKCSVCVVPLPGRKRKYLECRAAKGSSLSNWASGGRGAGIRHEGRRG
jgi:hypothetical protein